LYNISDSKLPCCKLLAQGQHVLHHIDNEFHHLGGISVGGGTLQGLSNLITNEKMQKKLIIGCRR